MPHRVVEAERLFQGGAPTERRLRSGLEVVVSGWNRLLCRILDSSLWAESDQTRIVWITLLAMADRYGRVISSIIGVQHRARVPMEACVEALDIFSKPDAHSTTDRKSVV